LPLSCSSPPASRPSPPPPTTSPARGWRCAPTRSARLGNDEAVISGILTAGLAAAIADAQRRSDAIASKAPDEKPPLGDGIPWQSSPDYADRCETGLVSLSRTDAKVDIRYGFKQAPDAGYTDELILKRVPIAGMDVGYWRIDNVVYADGTDLRAALVHAFDGY